MADATQFRTDPKTGAIISPRRANPNIETDGGAARGCHWRQGWGPFFQFSGPDAVSQAWLATFEQDGRQLRYERGSKSYSLYMPGTARLPSCVNADIGFALWNDLTDEERIAVFEYAFGLDFLLSLRPANRAARLEKVRADMDGLADLAGKIAATAAAMREAGAA